MGYIVVVGVVHGMDVASNIRSNINAAIVEINLYNSCLVDFVHII